MSQVSDQLNSILNEEQIDAFTEILNIGVGRAAASLSQLLGNRIELTIPHHVFVQSIEKLRGTQILRDTANTTIIYQDFDGMIDGRACLMFGKESSLLLASVLAGTDEAADELDLELSGILLEVGNIVLNGILGSFSNALHSLLHYTVPELSVTKTVYDVMRQRNIKDSTLLMANVHFRISDNEMNGSIMVVFSLKAVNQIVNSLLGEIPVQPAK